MDRGRDFSEVLLGQRSRGICGLYSDITLPLSMQSWRPIRTVPYRHGDAAKIGLPLEADWSFGVSSRKKGVYVSDSGTDPGHSPDICWTQPLRA